MRDATLTSGTGTGEGSDIRHETLFGRYVPAQGSEQLIASASPPVPAFVIHRGLRQLSEAFDQPRLVRYNDQDHMTMDIKMDDHKVSKSEFKARALEFFR